MEFEYILSLENKLNVFENETDISLKVLKKDLNELVWIILY